MGTARCPLACEARERSLAAGIHVWNTGEPHGSSGASTPPAFAQVLGLLDQVFPPRMLICACSCPVFKASLCGCAQLRPWCTQVSGAGGLEAVSRVGELCPSHPLNFDGANK